MAKYAIAPTAVYRNGVIVPGGTPFGIRQKEVAEFKARGFQIIEPEPKTAESGTKQSPAQAEQTAAKRKPGRPRKTRTAPAQTKGEQ